MEAGKSENDQLLFFTYCIFPKTFGLLIRNSEMQLFHSLGVLSDALFSWLVSLSWKEKQRL